MKRNTIFALSAALIVLSVLNVSEASAQFRGPVYRQPVYRPAPVYRPMPVPMYRPMPVYRAPMIQPVYRPTPAPMYRPAPMPTYRPVYRPMPLPRMQSNIYGPMAGSTPMVVRPSPYSQAITQFGQKAVTATGRYIGGTYAGKAIIGAGYPVAGRTVMGLRGGPIGTFVSNAFWPTCVGEGCGPIQRKIFP